MYKYNIVKVTARNQLNKVLFVNGQWCFILSLTIRLTLSPENGGKFFVNQLTVFLVTNFTLIYEQITVQIKRNKLNFLSFILSLLNRLFL